MVLSACLCAALMAGCGTKVQTPKSSPAAESQIETESISTPDSTQETAESEADLIEEMPETDRLPKRLDASDGSMTLFTPEAWSTMAGVLDASGSLDQEFPLTAGNEAVPAYLIANRESKTETSLASLEEYANTLTDVIMADARFENAEIVTDGEAFAMQGEGLTAKKTKFRASFVQDETTIDLVYWIYAVEGNEGYYQINCWTTAECAEREEAVFDAVAASLTEASMRTEE